MKKNTIEKLISETINGDKLAQSKLYLIYKNKINLFLKKKYGNKSDYNDDISEIIFKIFNKLKNFDSTKSNFDTWVITIAKNYMIDKCKKKKPHYVSFISDNQSSDNFDYHEDDIYQMIEPTSDDKTPYELLELNDSMKHISNQLTIVDFSMLSMRYIDGYTYKEIAKEFRSNDMKISNRIYNIKSKIKKGEI